MYSPIPYKIRLAEHTFAQNETYTKFRIKLWNFKDFSKYYDMHYCTNEGSCSV